MLILLNPPFSSLHWRKWKNGPGVTPAPLAHLFQHVTIYMLDRTQSQTKNRFVSMAYRTPP
jgi:hypothetical protein